MAPSLPSQMVAMGDRAVSQVRKTPSLRRVMPLRVPETAIPAGDERIDEIVRECFVANPVEDGHAETVESRDAFFCAEPEIAIHGLRDGIHGILGKPVVIGESGLDVLMHGAGPIQSGACGSKHTGQDKQH
jgi:hypothetical protein